MRVVSVSMRDFRTYARAEARLGEGLTVVHGPNGAGKSNLLEALYFGCTGRSPRTRNDRELVRFGAKVARVVVNLLDEGEPHELTVGYGTLDASPPARQADDGRRSRRRAPARHPASRPLVSVFLPERLELVKGAAGGAPCAPRPVRRRALAACVRRPAASTRACSHSATRCSPASAPGEPRRRRWPAGTVSSRARRSPLRDHRDGGCGAARRAVRQARRGSSAAAGEATLEYRPRSRAGTRTSSSPSCRSASPATWSAASPATARTATSSRCCATDASCASTAPRASSAWRCSSLLLAERAVLARERGRTPLMLLDDVMSELDGERRELLAGELSTAGQSVIATTDLAHVPGACGARRSRGCASPPARSCRRRSPHEQSRSAQLSAALEELDLDARAGDHARARPGGLGATRPAPRSPRPPVRRPSATAC